MREASTQGGSPDLVTLLGRAIAQREAVRHLAFQTYRAELATALSDFTRGKATSDSLERVTTIACGVAATAALDPVHHALHADAIVLEAFATVARGGGDREERAMLIAGAGLVDRLRASTIDDRPAFPN